MGGLGYAHRYRQPFGSWSGPDPAIKLVPESTCNRDEKKLGCILGTLVGYTSIRCQPKRLKANRFCQFSRTPASVRSVQDRPTCAMLALPGPAALSVPVRSICPWFLPPQMLAPSPLKTRRPGPDEPFTLSQPLVGQRVCVPNKYMLYLLHSPLSRAASLSALPRFPIASRLLLARPTPYNLPDTVSQTPASPTCHCIAALDSAPDRYGNRRETIAGQTHTLRGRAKTPQFLWSVHTRRSTTVRARARAGALLPVGARTD